MGFQELLLSGVFVIIPLAIAIVLKLGLTKDIVIASVRSIVQLLIVGVILTFVFDSDSSIYMILMIIVMIGAASQNVIKKGTRIPGIKWIIILTLTAVEAVSMSNMQLLGILDFQPGQLIPIRRIIISKFIDEHENSEEMIELISSFGGQPKHAVSRSLKSAIQTSMIPTIESQKTIGLVQLPGMMSGLIIGGAAPMEAVMYQLLILFLILTNATAASVMVGYLSYPKLFNSRLQYMGLKNE